MSKKNAAVVLFVMTISTMFHVSVTDSNTDTTRIKNVNESTFNANYFYKTQIKKDSSLKENESWRCVRWTWEDSYNPYNRRVICLDWRKEDCSKRLHKELCKGNR